MGFLFPLFLIAGLSLAIPILIHLFNLRRYKRVNFPDTRFLRHIQLSTKRQAKIKNWRLLLMRLLFLAMLILAFAQPYWGSHSKKDAQNVITAIYIDNSFSMTMGSGQESLLQKAKNKARQLVAAAGKDARFLVITNDRNAAMRPMLPTETAQLIADIQPTAKTLSAKQLINALVAAQANDNHQKWHAYCFTDLQAPTFLKDDGKITVPENIDFYVYSLNTPEANNIYIDTAYFLSPNLDTRQSNPLVVRVKQSGVAKDGAANLQVTVGNQVRAVSNREFKGSQELTDTLNLQLNGNGWQNISVVVQDYPLSFDDTFRIAARTAPEMSILMVSEGGINPYLQTALRNNEGFKVQMENAGAVQKDNWKQYGLIVLQNISFINAGLEVAVKEALDRGQNILMFPGKINNLSAFNASLQKWGAVQLLGEDTTQQQVATLQSAHPLLQDLFEKIPENVQLPTTVKRYPIDAGFAANQQSLMSFKDGKPFLAQYNFGKGKLYLCASALDDRSTNFAMSYFFAPILYKMAVQSGGGNMYAITIGSAAPIWVPVSGADDRKVWHINGEGIDAIPSQRPSGVGTDLFLGSAINKAGFYKLYSEAVKDTLIAGVNAARTESELQFGTKAALEDRLKPAKITWINEKSIAQQGWQNAGAPFPLWKLCLVVALVCLALETLLLLRLKKKNASVITD